MKSENKKFWSNGYTFLIYFSILFTLLAFSSAEATTSVTLTPNSLSANVPSTTELTADTASPGNTVWVDIFIDADKDGIIDPEKAKFMSFSLTDGIDSPKIAGVTNTNINGDEDGTVNSSITTTLKFYDPPNPAGQYIIQVTDENLSHAEAIFTFTQAATSQSISGTVTCDGSPIAGASVYIESFNDDDCEVGAAITDQDGNYQIYLEDPGTYSVDVSAQGYLGKEIDGGSELDCIIVDGHETGKDLKLFNGNRHITGTIKDKDTDQGIGGVEVEAEIENDIEYWSEAITDHDGRFDIVVIDGDWELEVDEDDLQAKGYVGADPNDVIVAGSDVSGQDVSLPPVTALITGAVKDEGSNPVYAWVEADTEIEGVEYCSETVTDPSGNYTLGVIAGDWEVEAEPSCEPYLLEPPEQYISIGDSQVKTLDFICVQAGAISGNVRDSDNQPIQGLWMHAFDNACGGEWLGGGNTDCNGDYTIYGLPAGDCYVQTCARCDGLNYVDEWWDNATDCNQAAPVPVVVGQNTLGINFSLEEGGTISGRVTDLAGNPLTNICVDAVVGNPCEWNCPGGARTDANGNYSIIVPGGTYYVRATSCDSQNYVLEWWNGADGTIDCSQAAAVDVITGQDTGNINFALEPGGSVSGTVTDSQGNPIPNIHIYAHAEPCGGNWLGGTNTDINGNYTLAGLPEGNAYVTTCAHCSGLNYIDEWWDDATDCNQAAPVPVVVGQNTPGINFSLEEGGSISGRVTIDPTGEPISKGCLQAFDADWNLVGMGCVDLDGYYTINGLPSGSYYVRVFAPQYMPEVYDDIYPFPWSPAGATPVPVTDGEDTPGIDFALEKGGSISGRVTVDPSGEPISSVKLPVFDSNWNWVGMAKTDSEGYYTTTGLLTGDYYIKTRNNQGYVDEVYDDIPVPGTPWPPEGATLIHVETLENTPNINFALQMSGSISGTVRDSEGNPIKDLWIHVFDNACGGNWLGGDHTDENGNYTICNLPGGNVYVQTCASCEGLNYVDEWYDDTIDCSQASPVPVTVGEVTPGIDFVLEMAFAHNGDVNEDGELTPEDALFAFKYYLGILNNCGEIPDPEPLINCLTGFQQNHADVCSPVDPGSDITPKDALCIFVAYLNGLDPQEPLPCGVCD